MNLIDLRGRTWHLPKDPPLIALAGISLGILKIHLEE
jgi:hypothetical protein